MAEARNPQDLWRHRGAAHTGAPAGAAPPEAPRRGLRGLGLAAAMPAVAGVGVALRRFLSEPPRPLFLSIAVSEYQDRNLPPNPWAQQDGDALRALFPEDSVQAFQSQERHLIVAELARLVERTTLSPDSGRPVVVHL